jgi:flagellar basal body-associated protein FliL
MCYGSVREDVSIPGQFNLIIIIIIVIIMCALGTQWLWSSLNICIEEKENIHLSKSNTGPPKYEA